MNNKLLISGIIVLAALFTLSFVLNKKTDIGYKKSDTGSGIEFIEADWSKAKAEAKKQNKLIFLDAYTTWCGPCKLLQKNTFPDKSVGEFFNKYFINITIDMEKGDGIQLARQYGINAYPTLIIADANGKIITYTLGYIRPKELIEFGQSGLSKK